MAAFATRISTLGHGLPLLPNWAEQRFVGSLAPCSLRASTSRCRAVRLSFGGDYGWPIGQDDGTWRRAWIRCPQADKGRKRHILVDTLGLLVANRVESADTSDRRAGALLLGGLSALFPGIRTVIADAGHESRKLAQTLKQDQGWRLRIVKRRQRAFKITSAVGLFSLKQAHAAV